jgi:hypothetical protein
MSSHAKSDNSLKGIGGAPTRATTLPTAAKERKEYPVVSGVLDYFPDAIVALAQLSKKGNDQHNPGKPLNWDRSKSGDEADTLGRHLLQRGTLDTDGIRHSAKMAWRALALLQKEIESESEQELQFPKYWFVSSVGWVYRAEFPEDVGSFWSGENWIKSSGEPLAAWAEAHVYLPISAEEAKAKGAKI